MRGISWNIANKRHITICLYSPKDKAVLYIKEMINANESFTSIGRYCKSCRGLSIDPKWVQKNEAIKNKTKSKLTTLKNLIGYGLSVFSLVFLFYVLIGAAGHFFKLL